MSRSGWRGMRSRLRRARTSRVGDGVGERVHPPSPCPLRPMPVFLLLVLLGRAPREDEEHVVERRPAQRQVGHVDPRCVEAPHGLGDRPAAVAQEDHHRAVADARRLRGHRLERRDGPAGLGGVLEDHLELVAADPRLQLVGRPLGDHGATVDHRDPVREPVGLVEVLGRQQDRRPLLHSGLDGLPELDPAARVEAGRGLVQEQDRWPGHERGGQVEAPPHAARVGAHEPMAAPDSAKRSSSSPARRRASARPRWYSRPTISRFSKPLRFSSTAAYCPARPMWARSAAASRTTSKPATRARA